MGFTVQKPILPRPSDITDMATMQEWARAFIRALDSFHRDLLQKPDQWIYLTAGTTFWRIGLDENGDMVKQKKVAGTWTTAQKLKGS